MKLTVKLLINCQATDRLTIRNQGTRSRQIGVSGDQVTYGGVPIGTFSGGISATSPLVVTFNASALQTAVQAVLQNISFSNTWNNPVTFPRTVQVTLTDEDGGTSAPVTKTINVVLWFLTEKSFLPHYNGRGDVANREFSFSSAGRLWVG